jgi:DNA-binding MarR family transcriptional regulator
VPARCGRATSVRRDRAAPDRRDRAAPDRHDRATPDRHDRATPDRHDRAAPRRPDAVRRDCAALDRPGAGGRVSGPGEAQSPRLVFEMMTAERAVRRWIDARAGGTGIGAAGAGVLFYLASNDNALVGDVTAALCASPSGMSGLITRMEKAGFLAKSPDESDARAVRLTLTHLGLEAATTARTVVRDLNNHLTESFTPAELDVVARWLAKAATLTP